MKITVITILVCLLLIAALFLLEPMVVAQPPEGVVAEPRDIDPFCLPESSLWVHCPRLSMKILSWGAVNSTEPNLETWNPHNRVDPANL